VLLLDDVQFLAGKESTQEEFFHTFNTLHDAHKQIVLTSDGPPNEMTAIGERLVSRFTWGVVADLKAPDLETRVAIVKKKAELQGKNIPNEIALLLASSIKTNIRDLEGSLSRLLAFSDLMNHELTVDFAQEVLRDQIKPDLARVDVSDIQRLVARHFNVTEESLRGKRRTVLLHLDDGRILLPVRLVGVEGAVSRGGGHVTVVLGLLVVGGGLVLVLLREREVVFGGGGDLRRGERDRGEGAEGKGEDDSASDGRKHETFSLLA